jgi:hypothetical protein
MLSLYAAMGYGAAGGLITEAIVMLGWLEAWRQARRSAITREKRLPAITRFIDPGPDLLVGLTRAVLGAVAGWLLRGQITGVYAALTVGASAPAVLATLGKAVTPAGALAGSQQDGVARPPERGASPPSEVQPEVVE